MSGRVTAIREHPRRAGRYIVELDGEAVGAVSVELIAELKVKPGSEIDASELERLRAGARVVACYDRALDALARRSRSRVELGRWLREKEFGAGEIEAALEKLTALGLLDDAEFARGFARSRLGAARGFGPRRVMAELAKRGVSRQVAEAVLAELGEGEGLASLEEVAARKLKGMRGVEAEVQRRRLYGFLARRGFRDAEIREVVRKLAR